jgi:hypothetical protein
MIWNAIALALQAANSTPPAADRIDIPSAYLGHWSLDATLCDEPGPANVYISARRIDFYERHGFLDLAQLNEATEPATFHGMFRWVDLLKFSQSPLRLEAEGGKLFITQGNDPDASRNPVGWARCAN